MVPKLDPGGKHKGWRVVVDYRAINVLTVRDHYPLPIVQDVIDRLQGKRHRCQKTPKSPLLRVLYSCV